MKSAKEVLEKLKKEMQFEVDIRNGDPYERIGITEEAVRDAKRDVYVDVVKSIDSLINEL